jgi:hypothetical protein
MLEIPVFVRTTRARRLEPGARVTLPSGAPALVVAVRGARVTCRYVSKPQETVELPEHLVELSD